VNLSREEFKQVQIKVMHSPGEPIYAKLIFRKFSLFLIPYIARLPVTPNMLTVCSIIAGVLGAIFLMLPGTYWYSFGVFLIILWYFLDVLDGI